MHWMLPLKRYARFHGRSPRTEFWMFALFQFLLIGAVLVIGVVWACVGDKEVIDVDRARWLAELLVFLAIALLIPNLAVSVRRLHDRNLSGWLVLMLLVPYLGPLVILVLMMLPGTRGPNRFGPDPRGRSGLDPNVANVFS
jgi:uncharacterized membrane protein YhaH (DUF805 family)